MKPSDVEAVVETDKPPRSNGVSPAEFHRQRVNAIESQAFRSKIKLAHLIREVRQQKGKKL